MNLKRKPRILLVSHSAGRYGAERSLLTLADRLQTQGLAEVIVLLPKPGPLLDDLRARGIESRIVRYYEWTGLSWAGMAFLKRLVKIPLTVIGALRAWPWARKWDPDLIYINTVTCPMGLILASLLGKPYIWHIREWIAKELNATYDLGQSFVMSVLDRSSGEVIFNSSELADKYRPFLPNAKPVVVYNGFDFSGLTAPVPEERYARTVENMPTMRLAVVGSIHPSKGQDEAIRALAVLLDEGFRVSLDIIGSGSQEYFEQLESLASELAVADHVCFKGYSNNVAGELNDIAVILIPSRFEPFGRIAVESMACGTPVVAAAAGGLKEIVSDSETGMLYSPGNHGELAEKISILLRDKNLFLTIVNNGWRNATQRFSSEQYIGGVWNAILKTLAQKNGGGSSAEE